jgi:hypothetical protein
MKSVMAIIFQCLQIRLALSKLYEFCDNHAKTESGAESLINVLEI